MVARNSYGDDLFVEYDHSSTSSTVAAAPSVLILGPRFLGGVSFYDTPAPQSPDGSSSESGGGSSSSSYLFHRLKRARCAGVDGFLQ